MSVLPNVSATAWASVSRMEFLKAFCVCPLASSAITTLVYSGTCGRSESIILFTNIPWIPPGMPVALPPGVVFGVFMLSSNAYSDRSTIGRRVLLCPLRSSLSTCALSIGPMRVRHWSALRIP